MRRTPRLHPRQQRNRTLAARLLPHSLNCHCEAKATKEQRKTLSTDFGTLEPVSSIAVARLCAVVKRVVLEKGRDVGRVPITCDANTTNGSTAHLSAHTVRKAGDQRAPIAVALSKEAQKLFICSQSTS